MTKTEKPHYVKNSEFSLAVVEYVTAANKARAENVQAPIVTNYIAECFLRIAEGLSHKSNFIRYTYREEMVMDAVENCLKAIHNYNLEAATRTGKPNAFAYFTQITWYAFLRRIAKEKKQQDVKMAYLSKVDLSELFGTEDLEIGEQIVESLRQRIERVKTADDHFKEAVKEDKKTRKSRSLDSDLSDFLE